MAEQNVTTIQHDDVFPTVHLNGTSKKALLEAIENAHCAISEAMQKLRECAPNGRDYYVQPVGTLERAIAKHQSRCKNLTDLLLSLERESDAINGIIQ